MASRVFISHSHLDGEIANLLADGLAGVGLKPWLSEHEIKPGDSFLEQMNQGLEEASYVLVLLSKAAIMSRWVTREWMAAMANRSTVVIPVLLEDCEVPPLMRDIVHFDLRKDREGGLTRIVEFFGREFQPISLPRFRGTPPSLLAQASRRQLRLVALRCLDDSAFRGFCFDAEIDLDGLGGSSLHERLVSLLHMVSREGIITDFALWLEAERNRCVTAQIEHLKRDSMWNWALGPQTD